MVNPGFKPSPIFEFYIYSIYRERGADYSRAKVFRVFAPGHSLALRRVRDIKESQQIDEMINHNEVEIFFKSIKRKGVESHPEEFRDVAEFVDDVTLTAKQVEFFKNNRLMLR